MKLWSIVVALLLALILPISLMGGLLAIAGEDVAASPRALDEVPADLLPLYRAAAATCEGLEWTVLAAIHKVETGHGRGRAVSSAGARGPMQFMPQTWRAYGLDGDGNGVADINDVNDAVFSAAHLLCANGAGDPERLADAIWNYNHSDAYVVEVLALSTSYGVVTLEGLELAAAPTDILANPSILLTSNARADVEAGVVDARLLSLIEAVSRRHTIGINVFKSGHSKYVDGTLSVSNHFHGRAVDITYVDELPVSPSNGAARSLVMSLGQLPAPLRPGEIGHPFAGLEVGFSDAAHTDHIHVGFD